MGLMLFSKALTTTHTTRKGYVVSSVCMCCQLQLLLLFRLPLKGIWLFAYAPPITHTTQAVDAVYAFTTGVLLP